MALNPGIPHFPPVVPSLPVIKSISWIEGILVDAWFITQKLDYVFRYYVKTGTYLLSIPTGGETSGWWHLRNSLVTGRQPSCYNDLVYGYARLCLNGLPQGWQNRIQ
ncbi:MAG: hypothetical protein IPH20_24240 [Bacteroidales bacterium]|nr:hypothetical protein [Bacteroidales bacterium]